MDNSAEKSPSQEQPKIPENWQFEERGELSQVVQIDPIERYLALKRTHLNHPEVTGITDYFFDRNGLPLSVRSYTDFSGGKYSVYLKVRGGEHQVEYSFSHHEPYALGVSFFKSEETSMSPLSTIANPMDGISFGPDGRPEIVRMARPWVKKSPNPPSIDFSNAKDEFIKRYWNCYKIFNRGGFKILDQAQPNKLVFVNKEWKKEYVVVWDTVMEEKSNGDEFPVFVVTQSHIDEGREKEVKIFKSPIQIDMEKVKSALLSKPPYQKDENGRLVVPWRGVDRIVGASLSYSEPSKTKKI